MNIRDAYILLRFFTNEKNLTPAQKNKVKYLLARDYVALSTHEISLEEPDIKQAETTDNESDTKVHKGTYFHAPQKMVELLALFSKDEHFKWYTHKWDQDNLTLENMIASQSLKKVELSKRVYKTLEPVNEKTFAQIWNFINFRLYDKNYYWTDNAGNRITTGWSSVIELHNQTPDVPIENLKLSDGHLFKDYIRLFKSSIEFRTDLRPEDRFSSVVRNAIKKYVNGAIELEFTQNFKKIGSDVNIYCDIPGLLYGLSIICDWIVKHKVNGALATIDLNSDSESYTLTISHHCSYFTNENKLITPSGDFAKLRERLFSVCDLTIFGDLKIDGEYIGSLTVYGLTQKTSKIERQIQACKIDHSDKLIGCVSYNLKLYKQ